MNRRKTSLQRCVIIGGAELEKTERVKEYLHPEEDYYIFCDCGLRHAEKLGVRPDLIVGDFDSYEQPDFAAGGDHLRRTPAITAEETQSEQAIAAEKTQSEQAITAEETQSEQAKAAEECYLQMKPKQPEVIVLPRAKDDTDSFFAAKEGIRRGFDHFLLLGIFGGRMDHTLANFSLLCFLQKQKKEAVAVDDTAEFSWILGKDSPKGGASARIPYGSCTYFSLINLDGSAENVTITGAKFPLDRGNFSWNYQYAVSNEVLPESTAEISLEKGRLLLICVK